jgi:3-deoxy-manno-octulosonate cytidylyltransferase (CMP-KDO synthetase)
MASTRLPNKPLADIHGEPMIVHVWRRAIECKIGEVVVACDGPEIADAIKKAGGKAVLTNPDHPSGSDRIWEALNVTENSASYDAIINVQGDLPLIDPADIHAAWALLKNPAVDIATLITPITSDEERNASQVVKAVVDMREGDKHGRALYFSRNPVPSGEGMLYHHVGLYAYRREALAQFVASPPSPLELREKLEQLRALSLGLRIEAGVIAHAPIGVDTPEDLERVKTMMEKK